MLFDGNLNMKPLNRCSLITFHAIPHKKKNKGAMSFLYDNIQHVLLFLSSNPALVDGLVTKSSAVLNTVYKVQKRAND